MGNSNRQSNPQGVSLDLVICTFNNAAILEKSLFAISQQKAPENISWSVLVVNNNSTDQTAQIVEKYIKAGMIPNLSCIFEPEQGLNHARHCGITNTASDWIAFVDDDCLLDENWVAEAARFAQNYPDCGAFGGQVVLEWETPPPAYVLNFSYSFAEQNHGSNVLQPVCLAGAGLVVSRKAIFETGWLNRRFLEDRVGNQLISGGDVEIVLRIRSAGYQIWYNPACRLTHLIPSKRFEQQYLYKINHGLGVSQIFADALVWNDSFFKFSIVSFFSTFRFTARVFRQFISAALGRGSHKLSETAVTWAFVRGKWAGLIRMLRMEHELRGKLIGSARLPELNEK